VVDIDAMAAKLTGVRGVTAVTLGGSRARGSHRGDSDWDLGVYYREPLDVAGLGGLAAQIVGAPVDIAPPGEWGPWVDGGAWLVCDGVHVDWILRDLDRVRRVWHDCARGRYEIGYQAGHPLGFWSPCYAGEVALGRVLADPSGELAALQAETKRYPEPLRAAIAAAAWEAEFSVKIAGKSAANGDVLHVSLCLSRAVGILVQALFAHNRRWCLNEKGALAAVEGMPAVPAGFAARARRLLGSPGTAAAALAATLAVAAELVAEVRAILAGPG
jgi:predicted nucleotidyltransferase